MAGFEGSAYSRRHDGLLGAVMRALCDAVQLGVIVAGPGGYPRRTARLGQWHNPEADCLRCEQAGKRNDRKGGQTVGLHGKGAKAAKTGF
jgi:hypothetical protein